MYILKLKLKDASGQGDGLAQDLQITPENSDNEDTGT